MASVNRQALKCGGSSLFFCLQASRAVYMDVPEVQIKIMCSNCACSPFTRPELKWSNSVLVNGRVS